MALDFALGRTRMDEMELHGVRSLKTGRFTITAVTIDGQLLMPTREFWEDLFKRYKLTAGWAEGKSYARRFEWLAAHHGNDEIPYRVLWDETGNAWVAPSRRRKIRRGKPKETLALQTAGRCTERDDARSCTTVPLQESENPDWLRRRRSTRHTNQGWPAARQSRLSNFFRGGRS